MKTWLTTLPLFLAVLLTHALAEEREWYHVSCYHLTSESAAEDFDRAFEVILPVLKEAGLDPIGVFAPTATEPDSDAGAEESDASPLRYLVIPMKNPSDLLGLRGQLRENRERLLPALHYLMAEKDSPAFSRVQVSLFYAFEGMPKLVIPGEPKEDAKRLFELRIYESHNEVKAGLKVEMFNQGEIDIFQEVGLDAVFFGEAIAGPDLPNLTYLLVYDDDDHRQRVWNAFREADSWKALSANERYRDTVSKIISVLLTPTGYSQIQ